MFVHTIALSVVCVNNILIYVQVLLWNQLDIAIMKEKSIKASADQS